MKIGSSWLCLHQISALTFLTCKFVISVRNIVLAELKETKYDRNDHRRRTVTLVSPLSREILKHLRVSLLPLPDLRWVLGWRHLDSILPASLKWLWHFRHIRLFNACNTGVMLPHLRGVFHLTSYAAINMAEHIVQLSQVREYCECWINERGHWHDGHYGRGLWLSSCSRRLDGETLRNVLVCCPPLWPSYMQG